MAVEIVANVAKYATQEDMIDCRTCDLKYSKDQHRAYDVPGYQSRTYRCPRCEMYQTDIEEETVVVYD